MPTSERSSAFRLFVASGIYYGCLSIISHIPGNTLVEYAPIIWDKAAHFSIYLPLGAILCIALSRFLGPERRPHAFFAAAAIILLLGALDETHQMFVVGRDADVGDVAADLLGGACGALLVLLWPAVLGQQRRAR